MKLGKSLTEVEKKFEKFFNDVRKTNSKVSNNTENTVVDLLLDPNNKFDEQEIKEELIMTLLGVS